MRVLLLVILLAGCGSGNHSYGWEYDYKYEGMRIRNSSLTPQELYSVYERAVICMGDKPPPFIIFTNEIHSDDKILGRCGQTVTNPPLILIRSDCGRTLAVVSHEMVHYFGIHGHGADFKSAEQCIKQQNSYH